MSQSDLDEVERLRKLLKGYDEGMYTAGEVSGILLHGVLEDVVKTVSAGQEYRTCSSYCGSGIPPATVVRAEILTTSVETWVRALDTSMVDEERLMCIRVVDWERIRWQALSLSPVATAYAAGRADEAYECADRLRARGDLTFRGPLEIDHDGTNLAILIRHILPMIVADAIRYCPSAVRDLREGILGWDPMEAIVSYVRNRPGCRGIPPETIRAETHKRLGPENLLEYGLQPAPDWCI
jgi:hypothetical protein